MKINKIELRCHEYPGLRVYQTPEGNHYPSISTVLGSTETPEKKESLDNWRNSLGHEKAKAISKVATDRGTAVHLLIERYLKGEDLQLKCFSNEDINCFTALKLKLNKIKPIAQEIALYSDVLGVAGRCDCIGYYDGVLAVIDFKTSRKNKTPKEIEGYQLQITFYTLAFNEMYNANISTGVVLMSSGSGFPLVFTFNINNFIKPLQERVKLYYASLL